MSGGIKSGLEKPRLEGEGERETDEAEDDCYDCCWGGVAAGFGHDGWGFFFLFFSLDWIGLGWIGVARRRWEEWQ